MFEHPSERLIVAIDKESYGSPNPREEAIEHLQSLCDLLSPLGVTIKINSLARVIGATAVEFIHDQGLNCFLDLKLFDTENTLKNDIAWIAHYQPLMLTVSERISLRAFQYLRETLPTTLILPVGPLTDMVDEDFDELDGMTRDEAVLEFFERVEKHRARGLICAPSDIHIAPKTLRENVFFITPAVKPAWAFPDSNSKNALTPGEAIRAGAAAVVVGRGITDQIHVAGSAERILSEIKEAL